MSAPNMWRSFASLQVVCLMPLFSRQAAVSLQGSTPRPLWKPCDPFLLLANRERRDHKGRLHFLSSAVQLLLPEQLSLLCTAGYTTLRQISLITTPASREQPDDLTPPPNTETPAGTHARIQARTWRPHEHGQR